VRPLYTSRVGEVAPRVAPALGAGGQDYAPGSDPNGEPNGRSGAVAGQI